MKEEKYIHLEDIFNLQDKALQKALQDHKEEWGFVRDCIDFVINRRFFKEQLTTDDKKKLEIVHTFLNDAISTLINSLRIAFFGCYSDSMALLRTVVEELTIMNYIVQNGCFETADYELEHGLRKLKFDEIIKSVKDGQTIIKLHGRISDIAAHGTARRIKANRFVLHDRNLPTIGVAIDPDKTKKCLYEIMRASLYMIRILTDFYATKGEIIHADFFVKANELEIRFNAFSPQC